VRYSKIFRLVSILFIVSMVFTSGISALGSQNTPVVGTPPMQRVRQLPPDVSVSNDVANQTTSVGNEKIYKVIAKNDVLDSRQHGITLWHDYGSFALYKVTESKMSRLAARKHDQLRVVNDVISVFQAMV